MSGVRIFEPSDIPQVAELWRAAFNQQTSVNRVARCFDEFFFANPEPADGIHSLVYENGSGIVLGFIGAIPRRMLFQGRHVRAAVATQLMVMPGGKHGLIAFELLRALFAGPQDFTFSDGANDSAQKIWQRVGGDVAQLFSLDWIRTLRHTELIQYRLAHRLSTTLLQAITPACRLTDEVLSRCPLGPIRLPTKTLAEEPLMEREHVAFLNDVRASLRPAYDEDELRNLFAQASRTQKYGMLRRRLCRDPRGNPVGWYAYYARPRGISQVLQLGGRLNQLDHVLQNLFADAWEANSIAVTGQVTPCFVRQLSDSHAVFTCKSLGVLIHSRLPELRNAVHRGDAFLSRLDGEWWLPFGADLRTNVPAPAVGGDKGHTFAPALAPPDA